MKFEWETLDDTTKRARVIGGWVLRSKDTDDCNSHYTVESMVFISDPAHLWNTEEEDSVDFLPVEELDLNYPARAVNCLRAESIETVGQLITHSERDLLKIPNLGRKSIEDIKQALSKINLSLRNR